MLYNTVSGWLTMKHSGPFAPAGRGACSNPTNRFSAFRYEEVADGWEWEEPAATQATEVRFERARSAINYNRSPDIGFDRSVNPYRGCEHGCIYCFARPSHAYLDLSPGLDFETRLVAKTNLAECLERELRRPGYRPRPLALSVNTDAYQPLERELGITRQLLQVLLRYRHPVHIVTKSTLILRDLDLLAALAEQRLVSVAISLTTLDDDLKRSLEPRAPSGRARLRTIRALREAGVPVAVLCAPMIPMINDHELERLLAAARDAGARFGGYVLLRLPHEVAPLFEEWLQQHMPARAAHVMSLIRQMRGGARYDSRFGIRMRGEGVFAQLLARRFALACRRLRLLERSSALALDCSHFALPPDARGGRQLSLF